MTSTKLYKWSVVLLLLLSGMPVLAQTDSLLLQADRMLAWKAYGRAIDTYTQLLNATPNQLTPVQKIRAQTQLAQAYRQTGDGSKAERIYRQLIDGGKNTDARQMLYYAQTLAGNGKFQEAQRQYEQYLRVRDSVATRQKGARPSGIAGNVDGRRGSVAYRVEYLALDSPGEEFSPAFFQNGLVYVAGTQGGTTVKGKGGGAGFLDLLYVPDRNNLPATTVIGSNGQETPVTSKRVRSERVLGDDAYTRPTANDSRTVPGFEGGITIANGLGYEGRPVNEARRFDKSINSRYQEGPATFSADGSRIIFTRNDEVVRRGPKDSTAVTRLKLYTARQQNGAWVDVEEMPFNSDRYSVGHPTLSRDGQRLYFVSDMPGGFGGTDLYVARSAGGRWGQPENLGETINSAGNELFPFVDEAGNLYFASDGRQGLGGLDIFFAVLSNEGAGRTIEHLDAPINSDKDDFGLITDAMRTGGYFSSNRRDGNDDILRFTRQSSLYDCRDLTVRVYDTETDTSIDGVTVLVRSKSEGRTDQTLRTDSTGTIRLCLDRSADFMFEVSRDGYVSNTVGFNTRYLTDDQPSRLEIGLTKPIPMIDTISTRSVNVTNSVVLTVNRVRGVVLSEKDRRPISGVRVQLRNECNKGVREVVTAANGQYSFDLVPGCDYTLTASKPTFGTNTRKIKRLPKKEKPRELSTDLKMLSVGDVITMDNIYYEPDRFALNPSASRELDRLVATMQQYPSLIIEIRSHTDSRGDAGTNKILSTQRANSVANYLNAHGISRSRILARGMGESAPVNNCVDGVICTEAEHQRNRRTEFRVVEIK
ncbi:carboxypeptidase regulatory-like domain-containing protein [Spirosoma rhododendri]|uniref:OmpA family protein n=1 Tax=Spirosoma rhododendri TaxID=2728024 RepID=A0A7L5DJR8_9BACT|nr:carboxypeptidase regulatory-like domain-containing protein [Spirosoma rhododendri]QJD78355.1 OmpA family protein [Spirosoma rhododendri]